MVKISAVICTYNGQNVIENALESLACQTLDSRDYEILVVDNASVDKTKNIVEEFSRRYNLKYILEPMLGLSYARNTGWKEASGEFVAYLDDDAIACCDWLERIVGAFSSTPEAGVVGGKVIPKWESARPIWLPDNMLEVLSIVDWSDVPLFLDDHQWLVGTNIAFPRFLLEETEGFSSRLGRKGHVLLSNEENLLVLRIKEKGFKVLYHPSITVEHLIPVNRIQKSWFMKRYYWQGVSDAILNFMNESVSVKKKVNVLASCLLQLCKQPGVILSVLRPSDDRIVWEKKRIAYHKVGYMKGIFFL